CSGWRQLVGLRPRFHLQTTQRRREEGEGIRERRQGGRGGGEEEEEEEEEEEDRIRTPDSKLQMPPVVNYNFMTSSSKTGPAGGEGGGREGHKMAAEKWPPVQSGVTSRDPRQEEEEEEEEEQGGVYVGRSPSHPIQQPRRRRMNLNYL
ncbi:unnamed protein product, partial [Pleuronectes platessa]